MAAPAHGRPRWAWPHASRAPRWNSAMTGSYRRSRGPPPPALCGSTNHGVEIAGSGRGYSALMIEVSRTSSKKEGTHEHRCRQTRTRASMTAWFRVRVNMAMTAAVDMLHVPHRSAAPALNDLLGGRVYVGVSKSLPVCTRNRTLAHRQQRGVRRRLCGRVDFRPVDFGSITMFERMHYTSQ